MNIQKRTIPIVIILFTFLSCGGTNTSSEELEELFALMGSLSDGEKIEGAEDGSDSGLKLVSSVPSNGAKNVEIGTSFSLEFSHSYDSSTVTHLTNQGACRGSIQLSSDNFFSCLGMTSNTRNNPSLSFKPTTNLATNRIYKLRVSTSSVTSIVEFTTREAEQGQRFLRGTVVDSVTGSPLSLVQVTSNPVTVPVVSDATGKFEISEGLNSSYTYSLRFQKPGYTTRLVAVRPMEYATYAAVTMSQGSETTVDSSSVTIVNEDGSGGVSGGSSDPTPTLIAEPNIDPPSGSYSRLFHEGIHYAIGLNSTSKSYRWNPTTGSWEQFLNTSSTSTNVSGNASVAFCGDRVFIYGGGGESFHPDTKNPNQSWLPVTPSGAPTIGSKPKLICSEDGNSVFVFGGTQYYTYYSVTRYTDLISGGRYNFLSGTWSEPVSTVNAPAQRGFSAVVSIPEEQKIFIWGGCSTTYAVTTNCTPDTQTGAVYDLQTKSWTAIPLTGAPSSRKWTGFGAIGKKIVVWGGYSGTESLRTGAIFHLDTMRWESTTSLHFAPTERYYYNYQIYFKVVEGKLMVTGGSGPGWNSYINDRNNFNYFYNPETDSWTIQSK